METTRTDAKRLFLLGAGFSKPAGMPTGVELTGLLMDEMKRRPIHEFPTFSASIDGLHEWLTPTCDAQQINIEDFYEYATHLAERYRLMQHCVRVRRDAGETPHRYASDIDTWLSYIDEYLVALLADLQDHAHVAPVARLAAHIRSNDTVVTLNYDCLVERCLEDHGMVIDRGMQAEPMHDAIPVLKLHGSIDWMQCLRSAPPNEPWLEKLFSKADMLYDSHRGACSRTGEDEYDFELYRIQRESLQSVIQRRRILDFSHCTALAGLGPRKQVSRVPGLGMVWDRAAHALSEADHIVLVGISLSPHDRLFTLQLAASIKSRMRAGKPLPRVTAIDPGPGDTLTTRMQHIFHTGTLIREGHEAFDWSRLDSPHTPR